jgi:hypothetical protein
MSQLKCIPLYLVLSLVNGIVPFTIALLLSVSIFYALLIWGFASAVTFMLISFVGLRSALRQEASAEEQKKPVGATPAYR